MAIYGSRGTEYAAACWIPSWRFRYTHSLSPFSCHYRQIAGFNVRQQCQILGLFKQLAILQRPTPVYPYLPPLPHLGLFQRPETLQ